MKAREAFQTLLDLRFSEVEYAAALCAAGLIVPRDDVAHRVLLADKMEDPRILQLIAFGGIEPASWQARVAVVVDDADVATAIQLLHDVGDEVPALWLAELEPGQARREGRHRETARSHPH